MTQTLSDNIDWDYIMRTIAAEECILFLGPESVRTQDDKSYRQAFKDSLKVEENPQIASYYDGEELFLFSDAIAKSKVYYQMKEFYQQEYQRQLYQQIARLPLRMVINASPDKFLCDVMGEGAHQFAFFHKSDPRTEVSAPTDGIPLVYNLTGVLEREESLLLTHDDLYEFLEAILARQNLPQAVTDELFTARSLIFLGFRFDKWYVQLLLRLLKVHDSRSKFARYATQQKFNADTLSICQDQFKIEFVGNHISDFVGELYRRCEAEGLLKETQTPANSPSEQVRQAIEADEFGKALKILKEVFEKQDEDLLKDVIVLSGRYNRLRKRINKNVIEEEKANIEIERIRAFLIDLCDEIE